MTTRCDQPGCHQPAIAHITGPNLPGGANTCEQHYDQVFAGAGMPRTARLIHDDGQDALFEIEPEQGKREGLW